MNPLTNLTPFSVITTALAFLLAFAVNAYNSGKIFNFVTTPVGILPYFGVGIPFVGAILKSLSSAGNLSGVALVNALFAGLFALLGSGGGAITHNALSQHFELPKKMLKARAAAAAVKMAGVSVLAFCLLAFCLLGCGATPAPPPNAPPDVVAEVDCVSTDVLVNHVTDIGQVAKDCTRNEIAIAADLITWLMEFDSVRARLSTDVIATLLSNAQTAKITAAQTKK